ncbi:MAG: autotransporter [Tychonema bourrellyi B0820]|uniref:Autotransporter n=1 Tax=Tychonema bourrellyi FEM_GT703 TaxID=2040638 RepID=A0A2G4F4H4_9CYAN|nr:autotransporter [Tychonema bourrellyi]MDQ2100201.1 autotransporter [Tychonema bourrellyi B0820]PHX56684.1 autotransporter [Tychonema bourrellyi FEM_GT703]
MRLQNIKLLTSATLSVLVSALSVSPTMANPATLIAQTQSTSTANTESITGIVKSIVGDIITIRPENERYRTLRIQKCVLKITALVPGMKVKAIYRGSQVENLMVLAKYKVVPSPVASPATPRVEAPPAPEPITPRPAPAPRIQPQTPRPIPAPAPRVQPRPVRGLW